MGNLQYETLSTDNANVIHALYLRTAQGALEGVSLNYVIGSTSNTYYYYHYNAHGDVTVVTDSNGNVYRQYTYDPYGNIMSAKDGNGNTININSDAGFNNAYLYAGYRYDSESGLYFLNARYYAAGIGRFLTKDSIINKATPKAQNLYAYVAGDPVNAYDPSGLAMQETLDEGGVGYYKPSQTNNTNNNKNWSPSGSVGVAVTAGLKLAEDHLDDVVVGTKTIFTRYTGHIPLPRTLGALGKVCGVLSVVFTVNSINDDLYNKKYTGMQKWSRVALDLGGFIVASAFFATGGTEALVGATFVAGFVEAGKYIVDRRFGRSQ